MNPSLQHTATELPQNQQPPLPPMPSTNPTTQTQQPPANTMLSFEDYGDAPFPTEPIDTRYLFPDFYGGTPFFTGPVNQGMTPCRPSLPSSSGPSRHQRLRKAKPPHPYHRKHESSGAAFYNRSTGVNPGMALNNASNNPGTGKVWRAPTKNPLVADCSLT